MSDPEDKACAREFMLALAELLRDYDVEILADGASDPTMEIVILAANGQPIRLQANCLNDRACERLAATI